MRMSKFCIIQGEITNVENYSLSADLAFALGDSIHESVRLYNTNPLFLKEHISNLTDTMDVLGMVYPEGFNLENINRQITRLLNVNKVYKGGYCKIIVYRKSNVFDTVDVTKSYYAIFIKALPQVGFEFNSVGKKIALLQSAVIAKPYLYSMYSAHTLVQHKSKTIAKRAGVSILAYFNTDGSVFSTSAGDIFYVKNNEIFCPSATINCFQHPITTYVIQLAKKNGFTINEKDSFYPNKITDSDEIFLIHPIDGVQWVVVCNDKTYKFSLSVKIYKMLEEELRKSF